MKPFNFKAQKLVMAAVFACLCVSCDLRPIADDPYPGSFGVRDAGEILSLEMEAPSTKIDVDDASGICSWFFDSSVNFHDTIAVYVGGTDANKYFDTLKVTVSEAGKTKGFVSCPLDVQKNQVRENFAIYPASAAVTGSYTSANLKVKYPAAYNLSALPLKALNNYAPTPMVALNSSENSALKFYHVGGLLRIYLKRLPVGTTSANVTFESVGGASSIPVTGTFSLENLDPINGPTLSTQTNMASATGAGNTVTVHFAATTAQCDSVTLNIPIPCGDYGNLNGIVVGLSGGSSKTKLAGWASVTHGQGMKLVYNFAEETGTVQFVDISNTDAQTIWKGASFDCFARAFDGNLNLVQGANITWSSADNSIATVSSLANGSATITAAGAGTTSITATATDPVNPAVKKTGTITIHVNEITSLSLSHDELLGQAGKNRDISATLEFTTFGNWSEPVISWSLSDIQGSSVASINGATSKSGEKITVSFDNVGKASLSAGFDPATYGSAPSASCSIQVLYDKYIPGKFSVSPTKQVFFSSGNLVVTYNAPNNLDWAFEEHQYSFSYGNDKSQEYQRLNFPNYYVDINDYGSQSSYAVPGTRISHFAWGVYYVPYNTNFSEIPIATPNDWADFGIHFGEDGIGYDSKDNGRWYTLSDQEWRYLIVGRERAQILSGFCSIVIDDRIVGGMILLPDNWKQPSECNFRPGFADYLTNIYAVGKSAYDGLWSEMEKAGAVFLPAAGFRYGEAWFHGDAAGWMFWYGGTHGYYHSSTYHTTSSTSEVMQFSTAATPTVNQFYNTRNGCSVRLVHE